MQSEEQIRARRREIAGQLLRLRGHSISYEYEQAQHWFYCLSEILGEDRGSSDFWAWVARVAA